MSNEDLTEAFGVPATAELAGRLSKRSPGTAPGTADPTPVSQPAQVRGKAEPPPTPRPAPSQPPTTHAGGDGAEDGATTQVSVYLSAAAVAAVRKAKARRTNADVALDAIDATIDQLPDLLATRHTTTRPGSLFPPRRRAHRGAAASDVPRVLWSMKATPAELVVIDRLVAQVGAASRSELIATAIEAHLTRPRRRRQGPA